METLVVDRPGFLGPRGARGHSDPAGQEIYYREAAAPPPADDPFDFVLSDATPDRYGDVIDPGGWKLANFRKNPIALFGHQNREPIGIWKNIRVIGEQLIATLSFAKAGTSPDIDKLRALVEQKILRATSVGFMSIKDEPLDKDRPYAGIRFLEQELVEASLVSVPANPNALAIARAFGLSPELSSLIFGKHAPVDEREPSHRKHAPSLILSKVKTMKPLAERITDAEARLVSLRDKLSQVTNEAGDEPDEASTAAIDELTGQIDLAERSLESFQKAERHLHKTARQEEPEDTGGTSLGKPALLKAKKVQPRDHLIRAVVVAAHAQRHRVSLAEAMKVRYPDDNETKYLFTKAASAPAMTTVVGWAAELVNTVIEDFVNSLQPLSVFPELRAMGQTFTFDRNGIIKLPGRAATPTVNGDFIGEGAPIPVKQMALTSVSLLPHKMAVISSFTRELAMHSTPSIESVLRDAINMDTAVTLDTRLTDNVAGSAIRPAGLLNGVTPIAAAAAGPAAMLTDLKALVGAITTQKGGRRLVFLMNTAQALALDLATSSTGDFIDYRNKLNIPIISSTSVPAGTVILVDAADFASATGSEPEFDVSDQATLHMEDTTPLAIGTAGAPATVAAPTRSLFQTASLAIRMLLDVTWAMRRTGMVQAIVGVNW